MIAHRDRVDLDSASWRPSAGQRIDTVAPRLPE